MGMPWCLMCSPVADYSDLQRMDVALRLWLYGGTPIKFLQWDSGEWKWINVDHLKKTILFFQFIVGNARRFQLSLLDWRRLDLITNMVILKLDGI